MVLPLLFPFLEGVALAVGVAVAFAFCLTTKALVFAFESFMGTASGPTDHLFGLCDHDSSCKLPAWPSRR
jgi:hypothetical protein